MSDIKQVTEIKGISDFPINYFHITEAFLNQKTNSFRFTSKAKTKAEVQMTGAKWFRQKGTGRARQGEMSNPHLKGGGKAHGPRPRFSPSKLNKRVKRSAWLSALAYHLERGTLFVIEDSFAAELKKTRQVVGLLESADQFGRAIICCQTDSPLVLSARNIHKVSALPPERLNVCDMMIADCIVFTRSALGTVSMIASAMRDSKGIKRLSLGIAAEMLAQAANTEIETADVEVAEKPAKPPKKEKIEALAEDSVEMDEAVEIEEADEVEEELETDAEEGGDE